ncbi:7tm odorant receptor domain-containing protein [Phthorimaea operculella]|nr:7tm odorant receptor domain-containing protein [Phthorimaea operculella]
MKQNSSCLATSITILKVTGTWFPDGLIRPWLYTSFAGVILILFFVATVVAEIGYLFTVIGDTERIVEAAVLLLSHLVQGVKIMNICVRQGRIKRLIQFIDGPEFHKTDPKKVEILDKTVYLTTIIGQTIIACATVTAIFWCLVPGLKTELSLPLKTAYPFDISGYPMFPIMYAYNSLSVVICGINDTAVNYIVAGLMVLAAAHLDVLSEELNEIDAEGKKDNYQETIRRIKYHQSIIQYVNELAGIFGLPILCQFMATAMIVCMTLYKITVTSQPIELMTMIFYMICIFLELFMYCFPGDMIVNKSLSVAIAAAPATWTGDLRSRRALLLCCARAQRVLCVNAGSMFRVSLPTAAVVLRAAYSYYAVLQQKMDN